MRTRKDIRADISAKNDLIKQIELEKENLIIKIMLLESVLLQMKIVLNFSMRKLKKTSIL